MSTEEKRPKLLILAFSPISRDARVQRQALALAPYFDVTLAGFGANPLPDHPEIHWYEVDFLGTSSKHQGLRKKWFAFWGRFFISAAHKYLQEFPYWRYGYHLAQSARFRVIYCNDLMTLPIGAEAIKHNKKAKLILDMHEYATREYEDNPEWKRYEQPMLINVMRRLSRKAHGTITVVESFVDLFHREFGMKKPIVVMNAPEKQEIPPKEKDNSDKIHLIHHGVAMKERQLEKMIRMMSTTDEKYVLHLMLVGEDQEYLTFLQNEADAIGRNNIIFEKPTNPREIVSKIAQYNIGLFILPPIIFNYEHALPNKFFDFIGAGLAIAIGPSPNMAKMINQHGMGWIADDFEPETMAKLLNSLSLEDIKAKKSASLKLSQTLTAETEMGKMVDLVCKVARIPSTAHHQVTSSKSVEISP
jgi:hypothetical protein